MSYHRQLGGLDFGDLASQADTLISRAEPGVKAGLQVLKDPAFPEVTRLVLELRETTKEEAAPGRKPEPGIGLKYAVPPLKGFLFYRQHPGMVVAGAAVAVGLVFAAGYAAGGGRRSR